MSPVRTPDLRAPAMAVAAVLGLGLAGCVRHSAPIVSTTPLGAYEWPLGLGSGTSTATYIFGFGPIGDDTVGTAIARAVGSDGDALINTVVDRRVTTIPAPFLPLVTRIETRVSGTVVVYVDDDGREILREGGDPGMESRAPEVSPPPRPVQAAPVRPSKPADAAPAPKMDWVRDGLADNDFARFFQTLRRGAAVEISTGDGRDVRGNFAGLSDDGGAVQVGSNFFGTRQIAIADIAEVRSRTIRGEMVRLRRVPQ